MRDKDFARVRRALKHGQMDDELLAGRDYDDRYWRSAKAALGRIHRELEVTSGQLAAFRAVLEPDGEA